MAKELSSSAQKVQDALKSLGLSVQVVELPDSTRTAKEAAQTIGCTVEQIVKSLVFKGKNSHKPLQLPDEFIRSLHILPRIEMERQLKTGYYDTVAMCEDSDRMSALDLPGVYNQSEEIGECTVYWDKKAR